LFGGELPFWYDQLGSFEKRHILRHLDGALEPYIVSEAVLCVPLADVLLEHGYALAKHGGDTIATLEPAK
jgi:hypothetical protein